MHTLTATPRQSGRTIRQGESDCAQRLERQDLPTRSIDDLEPAPAQVRAMPELGAIAGEHTLTPAGEQEHQHEQVTGGSVWMREARATVRSDTPEIQEPLPRAIEQRLWTREHLG